jgi:hypothetical protein
MPLLSQQKLYFNVVLRAMRCATKPPHSYSLECPNCLSLVLESRCQNLVQCAIKEEFVGTA